MKITNIVFLGAVKSLGATFIYLNLINVLFGVYGFLRYIQCVLRKPAQLVLLLYIFIYVIYWASQYEFSVVFRTVQLVLLVSFLYFLIDLLSKNKINFKYGTLSLIVINAIACFLEPFVLGDDFGVGSVREVLGVYFFRFDGIAGDPNYSSLIFGFLFIVSVHE